MLIRKNIKTAKSNRSSFIPLSVPSITGNEKKYVNECLDTEWVSSAGKYVDKFESDICNYTKALYAIACVNGTCALQVALQILGIESDDEILVPTVTFISTVNVIRYHNAIPVFMDCDEYFNLDTEKVLDFILSETTFRDGYTINKKTNKKIKAIIPVHVFGNAVNLDPIMTICKDRNIKILEDAAESLGSFYLSADNRCHTGLKGDIGCISFNGNKIITCGGGGMIITKNEAYAKKARYLSTQAKDDPIYFIHNSIGYNFRMTNIQAAIGVAQLEKLNAYITIKERNFDKYKAKIDSIPGLTLNSTPSYSKNNLWMYALLIEKKIYGIDRNSLLELLRKDKIETRPLWRLNHLQKPYVCYQTYKIEKALELYDKTLSIPCSVNLKQEDIEAVIEGLMNYCQG